MNTEEAVRTAKFRNIPFSRAIKGAVACKRAFERRFGQSMMPLRLTEFTHPNGADCLRVFDSETGSWAEYNVSGWRIRLMRSLDASNL